MILLAYRYGKISLSHPSKLLTATHPYVGKMIIIILSESKNTCEERENERIYEGYEKNKAGLKGNFGMRLYIYTIMRDKIWNAVVFM